MSSRLRNTSKIEFKILPEGYNVISTAEHDIKEKERDMGFGGHCFPMLRKQSKASRTQTAKLARGWKWHKALGVDDCLPHDADEQTNSRANPTALRRGKSKLPTSVATFAFLQGKRTSTLSVSERLWVWDIINESHVHSICVGVRWWEASAAAAAAGTDACIGRDRDRADEGQRKNGEEDDEEATEGKHATKLCVRERMKYVSGRLDT